MDILKQVKEGTEFLDDCVAMCEAVRCLEEKGAESIDTEGVTLTEAVFDRCFPGKEWHAVLIDGEPIGLETKTALYRGFVFDTVREADHGDR